MILSYPVSSITKCNYRQNRPLLSRRAILKVVGMASIHRDLSFSIDRGGTFTDVFAEVRHNSCISMTEYGCLTAYSRCYLNDVS